MISHVAVDALDAARAQSEVAATGRPDTLSVNLGVLGAQLSRAPRQRPDPVLTLRALLDVLTTAAQRDDLFVVFDEFSGIANVKGGAAVLRTELQHHFQELGIVFADAEPSILQALFSERAQPFFAQADLVEIEPLTDDTTGNGILHCRHEQPALVDPLLADWLRGRFAI